MKEVKVKLYKFEELSEEVRKSIVDKERWNVGYETMDCYASDYEGTLKKFTELMGVKVNYEVSYCGYHFSFDFQNDYAFGNYWLDYCISHEECTGKLLRRWLNNNFMPFALDAKKYYKYDAGYNREKHRWNKQRFSKIQRESWDNCPLTGMCYDYEVMKPIVETLAKPISKSFSLKDLVEKCLDNLFSAWHKEYEYWCDTDSAIEEQLTNWNEGNLFYEDGTKFNGIYEEAA